MMQRVYAFSAAVLCIGLVTCILAGCFGGSDETTSSATETTASSSITTTTTDEGSTTTSGSATTSVSVTTTEAPTLVDGLPREYLESLGNRPIVVLFYVPDGVDDEEVLKTVQELQGTYGNYTFLIYDYRVPAAYGDLSQELGVDYPPQVTLLDRNGVVRTVWSGYVDKASLNQTLLNLGRY